jgi:hypothetical protein
MLSLRVIFEEIRANNDAFRLLVGTAARNELQGGCAAPERPSALGAGQSTG